MSSVLAVRVANIMLILCHKAPSPVAVATPVVSEAFPQKNLLTSLQAPGGTECLVPVQETGAESSPLQKVCPCQGAVSPGQGVIRERQ